ncbi:MAG: hypothetical protein M9894_38940 [Planctomycetes bacterium]|nr:hypothetical protein [Planctomycetota bacterium]
MTLRRPLVLLAALLTGAAALDAREREVAGAWQTGGDDPVALTVERDGASLALARARGGVVARGSGRVSRGGWLAARFGAAPGLSGAVVDPVALARAGQPPGGFGLWEVLEEGGPPRLRGFFTHDDGTRRFEVATRAGARAPDEAGGFARHLREAIALNQARRPLYEQRTGGASGALSRRLVRLERLSLPWATWIDWRARSWNRRGVMVVAGDFVAMENVLDPATPPPRQGRATDAQLDAVEARLKAFRRDTGRALDAGRFDEVARLGAALLRELEESEAAWGCSLAMSKHVVEQIGYAGLNALTWRAESDGKTDGLARSFIKGLRLALDSSVGVDRQAQASHALGVGIIVNDVPEIPLAAAWEAWASRRQ